MAAKGKKGRGPKPTRQRRPKQSDVEAQEVADLVAAIAAGAPPSGANLLKASPEPPAYAGVATFELLPLSRKTQRGLAEAKFTALTAIQRAAIPHALCGRDILGAAKTGSGKTLAFLIPVRLPTPLPGPQSANIHIFLLTAARVSCFGPRQGAAGHLGLISGSP